MRLGSTFPTKNLPSCYSSKSYDAEAAKAKLRGHFVVGEGKYTYWWDDGERSSHWTSWSTNSVEEAIKKYHHPKLHGDFALYPLITTQALYGTYMDFASKGKIQEFEEKRSQVRSAIVQSLERYLNSFAYRLIRFLLAAAK